MRTLAVDLGTSNTVAALRIGSSEPRLLRLSGEQTLSSAVWLDRNGQLVVGRDAERQARLDAARFEPTPKLRVGEGQVLLGNQAVPVVNLLAALLGQVLAEARREGGEPDQFVLTHPAAWGKSRRDVLMEATRLAGVRCPVRLMPEPVAAAGRFVTLPDVRLQPGQALAVLDVGGGTTDVAVVKQGPGGWEVLADGGTDIGGRDLDFELLRHLRTGDPLWTELERPATPAARRVARTLAEDVRAAKEALSRYAHTDIPMPPPLPDAHLTRGEFETLVRPLLTKVVDVLSEVLGRARPGPLAGVFLVGGCTRVPLLASLVTERTGLQPIVLESPECTVALGALAEARQPPPSQETTVVQRRPWTPPQPIQPPPPPPVPPVAPKKNWLPVAVIGLVVVAVATLVVVLTAQSGGETPTGNGSTTAVPAAPDSAAADRRKLFGADEELLRLAVPAIDNADRCVNAKGSLTDKYSSRTQVQCTMVNGNKELIIEFMSGDSRTSCNKAVEDIDFKSQKSGTWTGNGRSGRWKDITFTPVDLPGQTVPGVYYETDAGTACAVLNPSAEATSVTGAGLHEFWAKSAQPH
ncbi:Hsp70 family protein [Actinocrispum sp. NPDC049592]|uniref:Hsp70 family protein n=1 Tax=Actinocrispum sp. NPDC049592 TaxID=3154835 RepID=UPI0034129AA4